MKHWRKLISVTALAMMATATLPARAARPQTPRARVEQSNRQLLKRFEKGVGDGVKGTQRLHGISAGVHVIDTSQGLFITRSPRREAGRHGVRVNTAAQILAWEMGEQEMVPGATMANHQGYNLMLMHHVGKGFIDGDQANAKQFQAVTERQRLVGAVLDVLGRQVDRKDQNVMVHASTGEVRLVDPDNSFGAAGQEKGWAYSSVFHKFSKGNGPLAYSGVQKSIDQLPPDIAEVIKAVAGKKSQTLAEHYGLTAAEAELMRSHAQDIVEAGLDGAVRRLHGDFIQVIRSSDDYSRVVRDDAWQKSWVRRN